MLGGVEYEIVVSDSIFYIHNVVGGILKKIIYYLNQIIY